MWRTGCYIGMQKRSDKMCRASHGVGCNSKAWRRSSASAPSTCATSRHPA